MRHLPLILPGCKYVLVETLFHLFSLEVLKFVVYKYFQGHYRLTGPSLGGLESYTFFKECFCSEKY